MRKKIPNFENYSINEFGTVFNNQGKIISTNEYKNTNYVRLYKNGKRYTISINKLLYELFDGITPTIKLRPNELAFRYENTNYYITNQYRVYNSKSKRFITTVNRKGYPTFTYYCKGKYKTVSLLTFLKSVGGISHEHK